MGQFIETQSQLVSEAKQARLERQQAKRNKTNIEYAKNRLKSYFLTAFETNSIYDKNKNIYYNFNNAKETYLKLLNINIKDNIIYSIIKKDYWENIELIQAIDNLYISQLKKVYQPYKEIYMEQQRQQEKLLEQKLFKKFQYCFNQYNNENMYKKLIQKDIKNQILFDIMPNNDKLYYDLFFKYDNILNKTYKSIQKSINIKPQKQQQERKQKETKTKKSKLFILFSIVGIILLFILLLGVRILAYILIPFIFIISFITHYKK